MGTALVIESGGSGPTQKQRRVGVGPGKHILGERMSKAMTYKAPLPGEPKFVPPVRVPHNGLANGEMESLVYRTAARSHRLPSDKMDRELEDMDTTGQQYTTELGKMLLY